MQEEYQPPAGDPARGQVDGIYVDRDRVATILAAAVPGVNEALPSGPGERSALEEPAADVAPEHLARPVDLGHGGVGPRQRAREVRRQGADREDAAAGAHQLAVGEV